VFDWRVRKKVRTPEAYSRRASGVGLEELENTDDLDEIGRQLLRRNESLSDRLGSYVSIMFDTTDTINTLGLMLFLL